MWDLPHLRIQCILKVLAMYEVEADSGLKVEQEPSPDYTVKHPFSYPPGETYTSKTRPKQSDYATKNRLKKTTSKNQKTHDSRTEY